MAHRKKGYRFEDDWTPENQGYIFQNYKEAVTIPVNVEVETDHYVLNFDNVREILLQADLISLMDCGCRTMYKNCDAPLDVCLDLNEVAERHIGMGWAREITIDEAMDVLEKSHEAGLVHMAYCHGEFYKPGVVNSVCSCCTCCCVVLSGILRFGLAPHLLTSTSKIEFNSAKCVNCGLCVDRC